MDHHQSINTPVARMWRKWTSRKKFFSISFTKLALRHKKNEDVGRRQRALGHVIKKKFFRTCRGNCLSSPKSYSRSHGKTEEKARVLEGKTNPTDWKLQPNVRWSCGNFPWTSRALWWSAALMIFKQFYGLVLPNSSMNEWKHTQMDTLATSWCTRGTRIMASSSSPESNCCSSIRSFKLNIFNRMKCTSKHLVVFSNSNQVKIHSLKNSFYTSNNGEIVHNFVDIVYTLKCTLETKICFQ